MGGIKRAKVPDTVGSPISEPARLGLRERNKLEKERMIREAARQLFSEKGYEATTLREVAEHADVGFGTVFSYAADKAGLLAMVYVEELKALPPLFANEADADDVLDGLVRALGRLYEFWARIPSLSWHVLQQMEFYTGNPHMEVIVERRAQSRRELVEWMGELKSRGVVSKSIDVAQAADTLFAVYTSAVREWSAKSPADVAAGLKRLRHLMALPASALRP